MDGDVGWGRRGEESDSTEGTGVQKRKQGAGWVRNKFSTQYCTVRTYVQCVLLQDGVKEQYPGNRNINPEPSGAARSERDFFAAVSGQYGGGDSEDTIDGPMAV